MVRPCPVESKTVGRKPAGVHIHKGENSFYAKTVRRRCPTIPSARYLQNSLGSRWHNKRRGALFRGSVTVKTRKEGRRQNDLGGTRSRTFHLLWSTRVRSARRHGRPYVAAMHPRIRQ